MTRLQLLQRPRRNRKSGAVRALVRETVLTNTDLVAALFLVAGEKTKIPVSSMPGINRLSLDLLLKEIEELYLLGLRAVALFPVIQTELKDPFGTEALNKNGTLLQAIRIIKDTFPDLCVISDVALDPYTSHGHDGLVNSDGEIMNDETVARLTEMALLQAEAGIDMVAPSDMMDGRIGAIRRALDECGFEKVSIHAYSAKYASSFYAPFREALSSSVQFGDKKTYHMDPANKREAVREALLDAEEGADILMVKPALPYLDVIAEIKKTTPLPVSAFQVSGEYAMIMAAAQLGWLDGKKALLESLISIKRAGADMIFTYAARHVAPLLTNVSLD